MFLRIFKHLLPTAKAWRITTDKKLRQFFDGLTGTPSDLKTFFDEVWLDIFPNTTRQIDTWQDQFGLPNTDITEQEKRDRLAAAWKALGGQDPRYIQDTLQANGFNVFVHEWWVPGSEPVPGVKQCVTPRNPLTYLRREFIEGEPAPIGYPLVNKVFESKPDLFVLCGEALAQCGEPTALCGNYFQFKELLRQYIVPDDPTKWPYFLYIGAQTFPNIAQIDPNRRDEFEALCLKICPAQQWLGILVEYP